MSPLWAIQDPRERPLQKMQAADAAHEKFADEKSDFLSYLNLWNFLQTQRQALTRGRFSSLLKKRFLSHTRVSEWREVHRPTAFDLQNVELSVQQQPPAVTAPCTNLYWPAA